MSASLVFMTLIAAVCLLLWGLHEVKQGISRAFSTQLHYLIAKTTHTRLSAFFSGMGIAALLQSGTATALILSGFCGQGLVSAQAGIAVMLGADIGTTLVAQILSFNLSFLPPLFFIGGFLIFALYERTGKIGHIGRFFMGIGLMLHALTWIQSTMVPLKDSELLPLILATLDNEVFLVLAIAVLMTWVTHSSLTVILLLVSFAQHDILPTTTALTMVLGVNLGACLPPLSATMKNNPRARQPIIANALIRTTGVALCLPFLPYIESFMVQIDPSPTRLLVNFHTAFNVVLALLFLPFTTKMAQLSAIILPEKPGTPSPDTPRYLDEKAIDTPIIALTAATRETLRIADMIEIMMEETMNAMRKDDEKQARAVKAQDDIVDSLYRAIKMYIARISQEALSSTEASRYMQVLGFASNLENAGDIIDKSMLPMALKKINGHNRFSSDGWQEIREVHNFVIETIQLAQSVFVSEDPALARSLLDRKGELRRKEAVLTQSHLDRIREGVPETIATSAMHLDLIRDYRRINGYMCAVAYPVLEQ